MSRFKSIDITNFDDCIGCPFSYEESTDRQDFKMCGQLGRIIIGYRTELCGGNQDYRNKEGVLNDCPFLKSSEITFIDEECCGSETEPMEHCFGQQKTVKTFRLEI